jgi:hypothetical protein
LATAGQVAAEQRELRALADPRVHKARAQARKILEESPLARLPDGKARLDVALDGWINFYTLQEANADPDHPAIVWVCNTAEYSWFGHTVPVSGGSIDNPDNIYRLIPIDPAARYEIHGQLRPMHPAQFSFQLVRDSNVIPTGNDNTSLGMINSRDLVIGTDGAFTITVDPDPANGRPNHIQSPPGGLLRLIARDTLTNWLQNPNVLTVARVDGPAPKEQQSNDAELAARVAAGLGPWVSGWLQYVLQFAGPPPENTAVKPYGRAGGWGYISPMRFHLADDEAMVITIDDGASEYSAIQMTDVWTIAPDPQAGISSYTTPQSHRNNDGTYTYVVAVKDPGAVNWVSTTGMHQGWITVRWQGVPRTRTSSDGLLKSVQIVKLTNLASVLAPDTLGVTAEQRQKEVQHRVDQWRLRLAAGE